MKYSLKRSRVAAAVQSALARSRAVALIGPRQVGKTTLARQFAEASSPNYFDLEDPVDIARLAEPIQVLESLTGLVVIDEVQRRPDLFPALRVLIDRNNRPGQYLILGSASPALLQQSSESLAGRLEIVDIEGLSLAEVGIKSADKLWHRGGFPLSFTASSDEASFIWREAFIRLTVERDLPTLGLNAPIAVIQRFWSMLAHYHGQIWSGAEIARSLGLSESTIRRYLDFLTDAFLVRQLQPWHENIGKRQIKAPKVYIRDSGLLHTLLRLTDARALLTHPKLGASWEGFLLEQVLWHAQPDEHYFWGTHQGAELDLLMMKHGRRVGVEFKRTDAPKLTPSMRIALEDLKLDQLIVVYPGRKRYSLGAKIQVVPATELVHFTT